MGVVAFRWQGKARLQQLRALLAARAGECLRGWSGPDASVEIDPADWAGTAVACDDWYELRTAAGALAIGVPHGAWARLGARLAGAAQADALGLAAGLGRRACADVLRAAIGAPADCELAATAAPDARASEARFGVAEFRCRMPELQARLLLDAGLCDALAPRQRCEGESLVRRNEAILPTDIALEAFLDLGFASLGQAADLRPGDVIKTGIALDSAVRLKSASGAVVVSGALVPSEGRRALRCSPATQE